MAVAPSAKPKARTAAREDMPDRAPERGPDDRDDVIRNRFGEPISIQRIADQDTDMFNLERLDIFPPTGWTYEWRVKTVKGWEWTEQIVQDAQRGWTPVPADRHEGKIMPKGYKGPIERGGQVLMERDERLTAMSRAYERKSALEPVQASRQMAGLMARAAPNSGAIVDYGHVEAQRVSGVNIERQARPSDSKYTYTVDE